MDHVVDKPTLKGYQSRTLTRVNELRASEGRKPILCVAPPGAGKSRIMEEMADREVVTGGRVTVLAHRNMLIEQLCRDFTEAQLDYTVMADGTVYEPSKPIRIASLPMLYSRAVKKGKIDLPDSSLVLVDEAHVHQADMFRSVAFGAIRDGVGGRLVMPGWHPRGADIVGFTATPLSERKGIYGHMVDIATYKELREAKMHQMIRVFGPDEIDTSKLKANRAGEYSEKVLEKRAEVIYGSVFESYKELNPERLPAILYAPSVESSKWFAAKLNAAGVPTAHLDGEDAMMPLPGGGWEHCQSTKDIRAEILEKHEHGQIKIICNRFVLREAINMPWTYHAIFATVMGGLTTYLQSVGRLQRYWPAYQYKILQDHGGVYWRHGSPNEDRNWTLGDTNKSMAKLREQMCQRGEEAEGIRCPKCGGWRKRGKYCPHCNHQHSISVRVVRHMNGRLKKLDGPVYVKPKDSDRANKLWSSTLFRCGSKNRSVRSAMAIMHDEAKSKGITFDWSELRNRPPSLDELEIRKKVRDVFPWTRPERRRKR